MKLKQKVVTLIAITISVVGISLAAMPVSALTCGSTKDAAGNDVPIQTSIIGGSACDNIKNSSSNAQDNGVWKLLIFVLNIMTAGVGILAVAGIVYGAILYTTASDKAEQTKKAIGIITNVVIGIIAYGLMYLVLNFLIPGGIFT
jgi:hypothetical protein